MKEVTAGIVLVITLTLGMIAGCMIQMTFDAKQDCKRFNDAAACEYVNAHPILNAWFSR